MELYLKRESYDSSRSVEYLWLLFFMWIEMINQVFIADKKEDLSNKNIVSPELAEKVETALENEIVEKKMYLNPKLSLNEVSKAIGYPAYIISWVFNSRMETRFNDFVNDLRIREAKKLLDQGRLETQTLIAIAYDAGFNSKSSFNRIFKMRTGITPSQYAARS